MTIERPMFPPVDQARRRLLTIAAAGATALTVAPARATAPAADPIYAAIERHKRPMPPTWPRLTRPAGLRKPAS